MARKLALGMPPAGEAVFNCSITWVHLTSPLSSLGPGGIGATDRRQRRGRTGRTDGPPAFGVGVSGGDVGLMRQLHTLYGDPTP